MFTPLKIRNTPNCLPFPWHPSVVYLSEGWNGHQYWMAQTPFPPIHKSPYSDRYELPCIHFSDDGIHFYPIDCNPIVDLAEDDIEARNYFSDPHLVFRNNNLEIYYRFSFLKDKQYIGNKTLLLKSISKDGFRWSKPIVIADLRDESDINIWGEQIISQSLIWDGIKYNCWYVDKSSFLSHRNIRYVTSKDGIVWSKNILCKLEGLIVDPWHIDVQYYDGKYQMIVYDMYQLIWYESIDGIHFNYISQILEPSSNSTDFYSDGLYRACSIKVKNDIFVYFSAKRKEESFIGCIKTNDRINFSPVCGFSTIEWIFRFGRRKIIICFNFFWNLVKRLFSKIRKLLKQN